MFVVRVEIGNENAPNGRDANVIWNGERGVDFR
jgi:hypothetical protein